MSDSAINGQRLCPDCGATVAANATQCWMCQLNLEGPPELPQPTSGPPPLRATFGITTIMLTTTLIAVLLGLTQISVGLAIGLAILVTPAYVRTGLAVARSKAEGDPVSATDKLIWFAASLGVVCAVVVAAGAAFAATCFGMFWGVAGVLEATGSSAGSIDDAIKLFLSSLALATVVGIVVAVLVAIKLWPGLKRRPR